jgi:hypothetical protein
LLLLTTTALKTLRDHWEHPEHGRLLTPRHPCEAWATARAGIPWAMDNDGFGGVDAAAFQAMVMRNVGVPGCLFLNAPDVFHPDGSEAHTATLDAWREWYPFLSMTGFPLSFVLQVGATVGGVPWDECDAVFIGGTTEWKLGPEARAIVAEAKRRGKHVHMGRVNSMKRIGYAKAIGVDSVDGTGWAKFRNAMMPLGFAALDQQVMEVGA